jgi:hypothetical protein
MPPYDRTRPFNELFIRIPANETVSGRYVMTIKGGPRAGIEDGFIFYYLRVRAAAALLKHARHGPF